MFLAVNPKKNFWDVNPGFDQVGVFSELIASEGKRRSSNIMWSIYFVYHPKSPIYRAHKTEEARKEETNTTFNTPESIVDFDKYEEVIEVFIEVTVPQGLKSLAYWEQTLRELDEFTESLSFKTSFKMKKEALMSKPELWEMYMKARDDYFDEESRAKMGNRGGYQESAVETGEFFD